MDLQEINSFEDDKKYQMESFYVIEQGIPKQVKPKVRTVLQSICC